MTNLWEQGKDDNRGPISSQCPEFQGMLLALMGLILCYAGESSPKPL